MPKRAPEHPTYEQAAEAAAAITRHSADAPRIAIILGSGLGGFVDRMSDVIFCSLCGYSRISLSPRYLDMLDGSRSAR